MKSFSSRPRSPTSPTTLTSADDDLQIMPRRVLFPTPAPAKMPTRCPTPRVRSPSMTRTPVANGTQTGFLANGGGGGAWSGTRSSVSRAGSPSSGTPKASTTRPSRPGPTGIVPPCCDVFTAAPARMPLSGPSGVASTRPDRKPTTSMGSCSPRPPTTSSVSPTAARIPPTSTTSPTTSSTTPVGRCTGVRSHVAKARSSVSVNNASPRRSALAVPREPLEKVG